jgi:hypothetical protein
MAGEAGAAKPFQGTWDNVVIFPDAIGAGETLSLSQWGNIVCGQWTFSTRQQIFSGYIAGRVKRNTLEAYKCLDAGQTSDLKCPTFDPERYMIRVKGKTIFYWVEDSSRQRTDSGKMRRSTRMAKAIPDYQDDDDLTKDFVASCRRGRNILLPPVHR